MTLNPEPGPKPIPAQVQSFRSFGPLGRSKLDREHLANRRLSAEMSLLYVSRLCLEAYEQSFVTEEPFRAGDTLSQHAADGIATALDRSRQALALAAFVLEALDPNTLPEPALSFEAPPSESDG